MCAKTDHVSLTCLRIRLTKLSSNSFYWFTLNFSSILKILRKLKNLVDYKERSKSQQSIICKNIQSKSCRELWKFARERRAGRGSIVVEECFEASLFLRSPHLHLL